MEPYTGDDLIKGSDFNQPSGLVMSEKQPFLYAAFDLGINRKNQFHMHYAMELGVVTEGAMERIFPDDRQILDKGDIWLNSMLEPHWWQTLKKPTRIAVFHIHPEYLASLRFQEAPQLRLMEPFTVACSARPRSTKQSRPQFISLANRLKSLPKNELWTVRVGLLLKEFLILLQEGWTPPSVKLPEKEPYGRLMLAIEHVFETSQYVTTTEAAKTCGLSRNRFHQLFMQHMGISFADFSVRHRLSNAASDLCRTRDPLKAIAERWGFADVSHFHRLFSELYRCSPSAYRKGQ